MLVRDQRPGIREITDDGRSWTGDGGLTSTTPLARIAPSSFGYDYLKVILRLERRQYRIFGCIEINAIHLQTKRTIFRLNGTRRMNQSRPLQLKSC